MSSQVESSKTPSGSQSSSGRLHYVFLKNPQKWRAGYTVDQNEHKTKFYFDCAECGDLEPVIAAFSSYDGLLPAIRVKGPRAPGPDLYCEKCVKELA